MLFLVQMIRADGGILLLSLSLFYVISSLWCVAFHVSSSPLVCSLWGKLSIGRTYEVLLIRSVEAIWLSSWMFCVGDFEQGACWGSWFVWSFLAAWERLWSQDDGGVRWCRLGSSSSPCIGPAPLSDVCVSGWIDGRLRLPLIYRTLMRIKTPPVRRPFGVVWWDVCYVREILRWSCVSGIFCTYWVYRRIVFVREWIRVVAYWVLECLLTLLLLFSDARLRTLVTPFSLSGSWAWFCVTVS